MDLGIVAFHLQRCVGNFWDLLATYREYMEAAVTLGEIDENTAIYVGDILQNIVRDTTVEASPRED